MIYSDQDFNEYNRLLKEVGLISGPNDAAGVGSLKDLYEKKLLELNISNRQVLSSLKIAPLTLEGILDGSLKQVDVVTLMKLAQFLGQSRTKTFELYLDGIAKENAEELDANERRNFIIKNFDLQSLKKCGIIESLYDYEHIEERLNTFFGFSSILEFDSNNSGVVFSSTNRKLKSMKNRGVWIKAAEIVFEKINNQYPYNREGLVELFPTIRWYSMNVEKGMYQVSRLLYKLGITLIYLEKIPKLNVRAATFSVNKKPCIVLTDLLGNYPTLWFALIHELHHVLYDWEKISSGSEPHLSAKEDSDEIMEIEANNFASEYLFSKDKMEMISQRINDDLYINAIAKQYQLHPSIIYALYCYDMGKQDVWGKYKNYLPDIKPCLQNLGYSKLGKKTLLEISKSKKIDVFNLA